MTLPLFIEAKNLRTRIGRADTPLLIDVRIPEDAAKDPTLVPGARQMPHTDLDAIHAAATGAPRVVILCQKGAKLSQGVAAALRWRGVPAQALAGGTLGWAGAGFPVIPLDARPKGALVTGLQTPSDLIALWTLRRWAAPEAEVWMVDPSGVGDVADRFGATAASEAAAQALGLDLPRALQTAARGWRCPQGATRTEIDAACAWLDAASNMEDAA
ncbi:MAG: rhodanese-like domain-containing protein [Pseudomonadota bacterium]